MAEDNAAAKESEVSESAPAQKPILLIILLIVNMVFILGVGAIALSG